MAAVIYSKDVIEAVRDYLNANLPAFIAQYEADHSGVSISPLVAHAGHSIDTVMSNDGQFPFGLIYEKSTTMERETLSNDIAGFNYCVAIGDNRADLDQLRSNIAAYRDAVVYLINKDASCGGGIVVALLGEITQPPVASKNSNYWGVVEVNIKVMYN